MSDLRTLLALLMLSSAAAAQSPSADRVANWHQWRGPFANGQAAANATPPVTWSNSENVAWTAALTGEGTSTPIIWQDKIFILSADKTDRPAEVPTQPAPTSKTTPPNVYYRFLVTCLSRASGQLLWQKVAVEQVPHEGHHTTHTYAAGSPTTDGERLYVSFGSRGLYCYSLDGELLWQKDLGDMQTRFGWGEAVTPVVHNGRIIVNWDQEEASFITCLEAATGEVLWKTERPDEVTSWNTPLITATADRTFVIANGTGQVRCYDLQDGQQVWSCGGQTTNAIPSPVRFEDSVIAMSGYRGAAAMSLPLDSTGDLTDSPKRNWTLTKGTPYVPSPVLSGQRLMFTGGTADILTILNAGTGKPAAESRRLSGLGSVYASPMAANGRLYFLGRDGTCVVLSDDDELKVLAVNRLNDATDASPVAVGDQLFLRSWTKLYCLQQGLSPTP